MNKRRTADDHDALVARHAVPYSGGDGELGVLLCHGFTGSPASMTPWAKHLEADGFRVSVPLLPGHGTTWQQMNATTWQDWYATVDREFRRLRRDCRRVFVAGLSMGGALALRLAEQHGGDVAALALVNPCIALADKRLLALPVLARVSPSIAGISDDIAKPGVSEYAYLRTPLKALLSQTQLWDDVRQNLPRVDQPIVLFRSSVDHVVDPTSATLIRSRTSSPELVEHTLENSYHVATLDHDAGLIFGESSEFFRKHAG
ncbi:alpha/beta fold hydrolase [Mariniluteicoccus endophyticus]